MIAVRRLGSPGAGPLHVYFNAAAELLGAIVEVLDLHTAFPRLSGIVELMPPEMRHAQSLD